MRGHGKPTDPLHPSLTEGGPLLEEDKGRRGKKNEWSMERHNEIKVNFPGSSYDTSSHLKSPLEKEAGDG